MAMKPAMTMDDARKLIQKKQVLAAYPRKGIVVVNGFKYFRASAETIAYVRSCANSN